MDTLDETNEGKVKLHDVFYTKEQILNSDELKKEYIKYLQYEKKKSYQKEYNKKYIEQNKEKVKEYARDYMRNRYHADPAFREKLLARKRVKPENKKSMGRPHKYNLDENLNLVIIKKE